MAASLLPSGATVVGFGGYVGSSRVDSSLASTPDAVPVTVSFNSVSIFDDNFELNYQVLRLNLVD